MMKMKASDFSFFVLFLLTMVLAFFSLYEAKKIDRLEQELEYERSAKGSCDHQQEICEKALERTKTEKCARYDCAKAMGLCLEQCVGSCIDRFAGAED
jgi:hypothetical protein